MFSLDKMVQLWNWEQNLLVSAANCTEAFATGICFNSSDHCFWIAMQYMHMELYILSLSPSCNLFLKLAHEQNQDCTLVYWVASFFTFLLWYFVCTVHWIRIFNTVWCLYTHYGRGLMCRLLVYTSYTRIHAGSIQDPLRCHDAVATL
jgi:hypothetical protein